MRGPGVGQWRAAGISSGALFMPEKLAPHKYRVRLIRACKHATLGVQQKGIGAIVPAKAY